MADTNNTSPKLMDEYGVSTLVQGIKDKLISGGKIKSDLLPSFVDDVVEIKSSDIVLEAPVQNIDEDYLLNTSTVLTQEMVNNGDYTITGIYYDPDMYCCYLTTLDVNDSPEIITQWENITIGSGTSAKTYVASSTLGSKTEKQGANGTGYVYICNNRTIINENTAHVTNVVFDKGKIYVDTRNNKTYRWGGTTTVELTNPDEIYTPTSDAIVGVTSNKTVGALASGTSMASLKGQTFSQILEKMLVEDSWVTPTQSHSVSLGTPTSPVIIGSAVTAPAITATWNNLATPVSGEAKITYSTKMVEENGQTVQNWTGISHYKNPGTVSYTFTYSYPKGEYVRTSVLGNKKTFEIPAVNNSTLSKTVEVSAPVWIGKNTSDGINGTEYKNTNQLGSLDTAKTLGSTSAPIVLPVSVVGDCVIWIPFANSELHVYRNNGFGTYEVQDSVFTYKGTETKEYGTGDNKVTVTYKKYSNDTAYASTQQVYLTFTLKK